MGTAAPLYIVALFFVLPGSFWGAFFIYCWLAFRKEHKIESAEFRQPSPCKCLEAPSLFIVDQPHYRVLSQSPEREMRGSETESTVGESPGMQEPAKLVKVS